MGLVMHTLWIHLTKLIEFVSILLLCYFMTLPFFSLLILLEKMVASVA